MIAVRSGSVPRSTGFEYVEETIVKDKSGATVRTTRTIGGAGGGGGNCMLRLAVFQFKGTGKRSCCRC
jgi:hypothetical protein